MSNNAFELLLEKDKIQIKEARIRQEKIRRECKIDNKYKEFSDNIKKYLDNEYSERIDQQNRLMFKEKEESKRVLEELKKIRIPWDIAVETMINKLREVEREEYNVVSSKGEWLTAEIIRGKVLYSQANVIYLIRKDAKLHSSFTPNIMKNFGYPKGSIGMVNDLRVTEGIIVIYEQKLEIKSNYPKYIVLDRSLNSSENVYLEGMIPKQYMYLIYQVAKYVRED